MPPSPTLWWVRRDLRLTDNAALCAALARQGPVIPVFLYDEVVQTLGAAPMWRLGLGLEVFAKTLAQVGSRLILRRGRALEALRDLISETGAQAVYWNRLYDPAALQRDKAVKAALKNDGIAAHSTPGHVLFEPWTVETGGAGYYRVYSPFRRAVWDRTVDVPARAPARLSSPDTWPYSEALGDWHLARAMNRGATVVCDHVRVGETAAKARLDQFVAHHMHRYHADRDRLDLNATSGLSESLTYGEISPRICYWAVADKIQSGDKGAEKFVQELLWREFAYHLMYHTPHIVHKNWRQEWDAFPWNTDADRAEVQAWKRGMTGMPIIDAAMREMYVTGHMHNRARMLVASYLTKHLMTHWKIGLNWFADCLVDWDPAANALGWQWTAGSGPDAAPYFRVFNPDLQAEKFDPDHIYRRRFLAESYPDPSDTALSYFAAIPRNWSINAHGPYPHTPIVSATEGRNRALKAYEERDF